MRIAIGTDHRGFALKEELRAWLTQMGHAVEDVGAHALDPDDDYPDFAAAVGRLVAADPQTRGIVACGSGIGVVMAANKVRGIRAGMCATPEQCRNARAHNDLNVLGLSADALSLDAAKAIITAFLETPFSDEKRHARRVQKLTDLDHAR